MDRKLSVVLGVLLLLAVIHHFIRTSAPGIIPFSKVKNISSVSIENLPEGAGLSLVKREGAWEIITSTNFPADRGRVNNLLAGISNLQFESIISFSPEKRFENGLSTSSAIRLSASGRKKASVLIGRQAFGRNHFYAGFENDSKSYLAGGLRRDMILAGADYYRNRRVASVREEDAVRLRIEGGGKSYSVSRGETGWDFDSEAPKEFYDFVSACLNMSSTAFYDKDFAPSHRIEITKNDGSSLVWELGGDSNSGFFARVPGENGAYIIPAGRAGNIAAFFQKKARG